MQSGIEDPPNLITKSHDIKIARFPRVGCDQRQPPMKKTVNWAPSPPRHSETRKLPMAENKGIWGNILRSISVSKRRNDVDPELRRASDPDAVRRRGNANDSLGSLSGPWGQHDENGNEWEDNHFNDSKSYPHTNSSRNLLPSALVTSTRPGSQPTPTRRRPRRPPPSSRRRDRNGSADSNLARNDPGFDRDRQGRRKHDDPWHPLTSWPPTGIHPSDALQYVDAVEIIAKGAPRHRGIKMALPYHDEDEYFNLFTTTSTDSTFDDQSKTYALQPSAEMSDRADLHDSMVKLMSMRRRHFPGAGPPEHPWDSIEQPSFAFCYGARAGTITLNHWAGINSEQPPPLTLNDPDISLREAPLEEVMKRIQELEIKGVVDEAEESALYKSLYRKFIRDPDRGRSPHKPMEKQITDLVLVLSKAEWIDFTKPRDMVPTRYMYDPVNVKPEDFYKFFHQLLFALELELRITWKNHTDEAKEALLKQLPPKVVWSLALARRWRDFVRVDEFGKHPADALFRYKRVGKQVRMLKRFAQILKWPNLARTLDKLQERDEDSSLDAISSHALAFFSGLVLPGPTFPFLIMNSLIDVDPDPATDDLALLSPMHPSCGFQYRGSTTYWTSSSIVGKVLAPKCREVGGWIGPAIPSTDLARNQIARIRARKSRPSHQQLTPEDVATMTERSDPLGPPSEVFPVKEYSLPTRDTDDIGDTVRIARLILQPVPEAGVESTAATPAMMSMNSLAVGGAMNNAGMRPRTTSPSAGGSRTFAGRRVSESAGGPPTLPPITPVASPPPMQPRSSGPKTFDASILFAIDAESWPLRLMHDVNFISAYPCRSGPHPLFFDYTHEVVRVEDLVGVRDWGGLLGGRGGIGGSAPAVTLGWGYGAGGGSPASPGDGVSSFGGPGAIMSNAPRLGERTNDGKTLPSNSDDPEKVLVVEAFGAVDAEVLARAWCAHWGLNAVVANIESTCMACAIREAYAGTITVVILVNDATQREKED